MNSAASTLPLARRPDLDWIRVGAFFLLILYHVGMFYVPWDFHVKSPHTVEWLEPLMLLTNPWRLTLLFLVSGAATRFMADKMTLGALTWARVARLQPPLIFAILVIVPPQTYYQLAEAGIHLSWADFYGRYITGSGHWTIKGEGLTTPTWNHMWFVAYLFVYSMILAAILAVAGRPLRRLGDLLEKALAGPALLLAPLALFGAIRFFLAGRFPETHDLTGDWYAHAGYFSAFLLGFLIARSEVLKQTFIRWRWVALAGAVVAYGAWASYAWAYRGEAVPSETLRSVMRLAFASEQWLGICAVLGFGGRHITKDGPVLAYLTPAVFPFYLVHQTIIIVVAHNLVKVGLPQGLEVLIVILATYAGCFATYEAVRRVNLLRPWFGLKPVAKARRESVGAPVVEGGVLP